MDVRLHNRYNSHMTLFDVFVQTVLNGVTTLVPISDAGHWIIASSLFGIPDTSASAMAVALYLAVAVAILVYFFDDVWQLLQTLLRKLGRLPVNTRDETLLYAILLASIPGLLLGTTLAPLFVNMLRHPLFIAGIISTTALWYIYVEWVYHNREQTNHMDAATGIRIGLFQALAILPGFSWVASMLGGAMLLGLSRSEAARFSFLAALPVFFGLAVQQFLDMVVSGMQTSPWLVLVAFSLTFAVSVLAIRFMLWFLRTHTLWMFIWYRFILAFFIVFIFIFG